MKKKNKTLFILLLIAVLGVAFAFLQGSLISQGTAHIVGNQWDVSIGHIMVMDGSVSGDQLVTAPSFDSQDDMLLNFDVVFFNPGDYIEFTFDVVNAGSLDAMIYDFTREVNGNYSYPAYLTYTVTYADGLPLGYLHILPAYTTETFRVIVKYRDDVSTDSLPTGNVELSLSLSLPYVQADSKGKPINNRVFTASGSESELNDIGEAITTTPTFTTYASAIEYFGHPVFLKHIIENQVIARSYIGFIHNNQMYYLSNSDNFAQSKKIMIDAFGSSKCYDFSSTEFMCFDCDTYFGAGLDQRLGYLIKTVGYLDEDEIQQACVIAGTSSYCGEINLDLSIIDTICPSS